MKQRIEDKLIKRFSPTFLKVEDTSLNHKGHGGYREGGESHFSLTLISPSFSGLTRLERHRQVYECLENELKEGVHALQVTALSPEEA